MAESIANRDEAAKCISIARRALREGDYGKAERFANKAMSMSRSDEVEHLLVQIKMSANAGASSSRQQPENQQSEEPQPQHTRHSHANGHSGPKTTGQRAQHQPAGMGKSNLHQRQAHNQRTSTGDAPLGPDPGTPEQQKLVKEILASKDLYQILGLQKSASEDDIRKAYRKLALKLHPDKNRAHRADEAFKAVGKAFACLSDPDKRAYYDRTGYESSTAAAAAQRQSSTSYHQGPAGMYYSQDFDPDEIFNMFFGGMHPGARVFRAQYGAAPPRRHAPQQDTRAQGGDDMQRLLFNLFQFLPVILLVLISMFAASQKSPFSLIRDYNHYPESMSTQRLEVPFFVKNSVQFDRDYPKGSSSRFKLERQIESDYYDKQQQRCQAEKMSRHRMWTYGKREEANRMPMAGCEEVDRMNHRLGVRHQYAWG